MASAGWLGGRRLAARPSGCEDPDVPADDPLRQRIARPYRARVRRRRRLGLAVRLGLVVAFVLAAGRLDADLPGGPYARGLLLVGLIAVVDAVAGLPFAIAGERDARGVGLSRLSDRAWIRDRARGALLGAALGGPVVAGLLGAQRTWPGGWPLVAWAAATGLSVLLAIVFPVLLLPLFVRSSPLPPGDLRAMVSGLVETSGVRIADVRTLHLGERTSAGNAMVAGLGPSRRILLGDTLLAEQQAVGDDPLLSPSRAELVEETRAVLAHELGHQRHGDVLRFLALSAVTGAGQWIAAAFLLSELPHVLAHGGAGRPAACLPSSWCSPSSPCHWMSPPRATRATASAPPTPTPCRSCPGRRSFAPSSGSRETASRSSIHRYWRGSGRATRRSRDGSRPLDGRWRRLASARTPAPSRGFRRRTRRASRAGARRSGTSTSPPSAAPSRRRVRCPGCTSRG